MKGFSGLPGHFQRKEVAKPLRDDCSLVRTASITVGRAGRLYVMVGANG